MIIILIFKIFIFIYLYLIKVVFEKKNFKQLLSKIVFKKYQFPTNYYTKTTHFARTKYNISYQNELIRHIIISFNHIDYYIYQYKQYIKHYNYYFS